MKIYIMLSFKSQLTTFKCKYVNNFLFKQGLDD